MKDKKLELKAIILGIRFDYMTNYRAELIHLKNENLSYKEIAMRINAVSCNNETNEAVVQTWFTRGTQPKDEFIEILENWLQTRVFTKVSELRRPEIIK